MRYQKVEVKIWNDEKFVTLSPSQKFLHLYLLTSPHSNLAGIYTIKKGYICEDIQADIKDLDKDLERLLDMGLIRYDIATSIVYIPNFLKHNPITNPNQLKSAINILLDLPKNPFSSIVYQGLPKGLVRDLPKDMVSRFEAPIEVDKNVSSETGAPTTTGKTDEKPDFATGKTEEQKPDIKSDTCEGLTKDLRNPSEADSHPRAVELRIEQETRTEAEEERDNKIKISVNDCDVSIEKKPDETEIEAHTPKKPKKENPRLQEAIEIIEYFNVTYNAKYKTDHKRNKEIVGQIIARLEDFFEFPDFKAVFARKYRQWGNDERMSNAFNLLTLTRLSNFEKYLNEVDPNPALNTPRNETATERRVREDNEFREEQLKKVREEQEKNGKRTDDTGIIDVQSRAIGDGSFQETRLIPGIGETTFTDEDLRPGNTRSLDIIPQ